MTTGFRMTLSTVLETDLKCKIFNEFTSLDIVPAFNVIYEQFHFAILVSKSISLDFTFRNDSHETNFMVSAQHLISIR